MKSFYRIIYTTGLILSVSVLQAMLGAGAILDRAPVADSMRRLSAEVMSAYERQDTVALKGFYAKQPSALFFWERQMSYSWPQIERTMDGLLGAVKSMKLTTREFRAGGSGDTGWFAATFHVERVTPDGKQMSSDGRWTVVAEKRQGRWLIVHEHTSFPLPEQ